uniref:ABC transporter ATP-binding protein n=1 Tax=Milkweed yellows phytoplasma TaxID=208434 RepID=UPI000360AD19|nr:ABC transporter ATP-binding protein [Milkweed yellows phytoplasma]
MKLVFQYIFKYKKIILLNILSVFLIALGEIGIPFVIGKMVIEKTLEGKEFTDVILILIFLVIFGILGNLIVNYCSSKVSSLVFNNLSSDVFKKIQTLSVADVQSLGVSRLMNRSTSDVDQIVNFIATFYRAAIVAPIMLIISLTLICRISVPLSTIIIFAVPIFIIILAIVMTKNYKLSKKQQKQLEDINANIRENITGVKIIKTLNRSEYEEEKFEKMNSNYMDVIIKLFNSMLSIEPFFYLLLNISILITTFYGAFLLKTVGQHGLTLGYLYNVLNLQHHILFSILNFLFLFMMFPKTVVSSKKIETLLAMEPSVQNNPHQVEPLEKITDLEFDNVSFNFPNSSFSILDNINFKAKTSELIAVVGSTGSGKSTLINLIPRLMDPTSGSIKINNIDIKNYDVANLRDKIGFVSQKNILFKGTIESNLSFGQENADESEMLEKAKMAKSYDFIQSKEKQLKEFVSELGSNFSGGQKQRLSITRTFLKTPDVYIFDDSFSALDYQTDLAIRQNFVHFRKNSIIIIVAQRLTSVLNADKIIVLDHGKVVDIGTHKELMQRCEIYKNIAISQKIKEVLL